MFPKSHSSTDHVEMVHWITQYSPEPDSDELIGVPPLEFDDDENVERNEDTDFDWE